MIKAAIFDLNGIFIQSPKLSDRFAEDFGVPTTVFLSKLSEIMDKVRQPNAGKSFIYWKPVLREWGVNLSEQEFWDYWFKAEIQSEAMIAFSKELRTQGIKVFILSNNFKERAEYYAHYPWMHDAIDKVYFSWQTGFVKPDPKAWELVLSENNLQPEECVYFDDQEKNLKAAESIGIKSFMFTNEAELERIMRSLLATNS
jgi:HAD superfamily hydrolase (TIGR01509 family)